MTTARRVIEHLMADPNLEAANKEAAAHMQRLTGKQASADASALDARAAEAQTQAAELAGDLRKAAADKQRSCEQKVAFVHHMAETLEALTA
jgi:hypothetical protein